MMMMTMDDGQKKGKEPETSAEEFCFMEHAKEICSGAKMDGVERKGRAGGE